MKKNVWKPKSDYPQVKVVGVKVDVEKKGETSKEVIENTMARPGIGKEDI